MRSPTKGAPVEGQGGSVMQEQSSLRRVHPKDWAPAKGYSNGLAGCGESLFIAGQIGWDAEQRFPSSEFSAQFALALDNVLAVLHAAGGQTTDLAEMTIYVTDLELYRRSAKELGPIWRARMGRHYPAMALVGVNGLVEKEALIEIQARALLPDRIVETAPTGERDA